MGELFDLQLTKYDFYGVLVCVPVAESTKLRCMIAFRHSYACRSQAVMYSHAAVYSGHSSCI